MFKMFFKPQYRVVLGIALGLLGAVAFSAKAIVVKLAYRHGVDAETLLALRMGFALPFFAVIAWLMQRRAVERISLHQWFKVTVVGVLGYYAASYLDFLGLQYISAALERLILFLYPTLVLLFAWLFYGRTLRRMQGWALLISYLGIALAFVHDVRLAQANLWLGSVLVFASAVSYAFYLLLGGELLRQLGTLRMTALASSIAALVCIAQFFLVRDLTVL